MALSAKHARFVTEYLVDCNATKAAERAGYSPKSAHVTGCRLLKDAKVAEELAKRQGKRLDKAGVTAERVIAELGRLAFSDLSAAYDEQGNLKPIHEIPEDIRRAIGGIEVEELFEGRGEERSHVGQIRKVKLWNKNDALTTLAKHFKLLTEKVEHSGTIAVVDPYATPGAK